MPPVSQNQRVAMIMAKKGKSTLGIPQSVGADFVAADPGGKLPKSAPKHQEGGMIKGTGPVAARYARGGPVLNTSRSIFMKTPDVFRTDIERNDYGRASDPHVKRTGDKSEKPIKPRT